jgi:hypothetical protein
MKNPKKGGKPGLEPLSQNRETNHLHMKQMFLNAHPKNSYPKH